MHDSNDVSKSLRGLFEKGPKSAEALEELSRFASSDGLTEPELNMVLDIVFDYSIRHTLRHTLISKCLIPDGSYLLNSSIISRVLGAVGVSEVYFRNGKQLKSKRLPSTSQNMLLSWLISASHYFGKSLFDSLHRALAILFGLLEFEYSRPNIVTLIIVGLSQPQKAKNALTGQTRYALKPWHLSIVLSLSGKFPFDPSLKTLLAYMKRLTPALEIRSGQNLPVSNTSKSDISFYPDPELDRLLSAHIQSSSPISWEIREVKERVQRLFESFSTSKSKRRKIDVSSFNDLDLLASPSSSETISIGAVESLRTLIDKFDKISMANPGSLFTLQDIPNEKLRKYFVALHLLLGHNEHPIVKKFVQFIKFHFLTIPTPQPAFESLLSFAELGSFHQISRALQDAINTEKKELASQIRSLVALPPEPKFFEGFFKALDPKKHEVLLRSLCLELSNCLLKWSRLHDEYGFFQDILGTIGEAVRSVFNMMETSWQYISLKTKVAFMGFLRSIRKLDFSEKRGAKELNLLVPSPTLTYQMLISANPFVLSEALGYVAFLRGLEFAEDSLALQLKKNYIMDCTNLLWLDAAFKADKGTFTKGMFLDPEYLKNLAGLNYFTYSDLLELKNIGDLSHNPAFSYLTAELLWNIEDQEEGITGRHLGPLSEDSVAHLQHNGDVKWVRKGYFEIKLNILHRLDALGYSGLCDLLFSSLRPLTGLRQRKIEENDLVR